MDPYKEGETVSRKEKLSGTSRILLEVFSSLPSQAVIVTDNRSKTNI